MNLRALLFIIRIIGEHRLMIDNPDGSEDPKRLVRAAGAALARFPLYFHELLQEIGERLPQSQRQHGVGHQFATFCTGLFKRPPVDSPEHTDFLRIAFLEFATNQWKKGAVNPRFLQRVSNKVQKRFVAFPRFREQFGLGRLTALRALAMSEIALVTEKRRKQDRTFVDMKDLPVAATQPPRIYSLRSASAMIGVSRKVLHSLRRSGHFKTNVIGRPNYGYHESDIQMFIHQLLALSPAEKSGEAPSDCITLHGAIGRYHGAGEGGAGIVRALLSGELPVIGNIDGTVRGLLMPRQAFESFAMNDRARAYGNARTVSEVAQELHCTRDSVFGLVQRNVLRGRMTPTGFRIWEESLATFKSRYVSLASIASGTHGNAYRLMLQCRSRGIAMLIVQRYRHGHHGGFVSVQDRDAVMAFRPVDLR